MNTDLLLIAEIGVNHNGSEELAEKMINEAANSGATAVKFQHFTAETLTSPDTPKVNYQLQTSDENESHFEMLKSLEISDNIENLAVEMCQKHGLEFISTPYDPDSASRLISMGCKYVKTASADITDFRIHKILAASEATAIISCGMATFEEIDEVLKLYVDSPKRPILLHCVSNYPCAHGSLNLNVIPIMQKMFNCHVGYSDHSIGSEAIEIAYTLGSRVFEKHFTIDKKLPGPDHKASSLPEEFLSIVERLSLTQKILGNPFKQVQTEEKQMRLVSRKSVFTKTDLKADHVIREEDLILLRPGDGISGAFLDKVIGQKTNEALPMLHKISEEDIRQK